ncbi:terminase small subunit [Mammaliicoccus sciuri]|uniref:terminase small subunit n=1 Tax=Mammaliicoccus sciuri TaxID=1296 RepID=UPI002DB80790|nr:terminase small subunit [Mammaliicoccus sciuri]MEB7394305.1 terminase small subunit [Mammaliicoccus sciuri]
MNELSTKQQRFADEYLKSLNITQSAINAGYSKTSAHVAGSRLLKNDKVKNYIDSQKKELMEKGVLEAQELLYLLSRAATGEETETKEIVVKRGEYVENPVTKRLNVIYNEHVELIEVPIKVSDRNKARDLLGKYHSIWTENHNLSVGEVTFVDDID